MVNSTLKTACGVLQRLFCLENDMPSVSLDLLYTKQYIKILWKIVQLNVYFGIYDLKNLNKNIYTKNKAFTLF